MKKQFKKVLSLLLTVLMVVTALPLTAGAATYSGTCGDGLSWSYDTGSRTLNITGQGKMNDYDQGNAPWDTNSRYIKYINLPEGLEYIGEYAFDFCSEVATITIPASVKSIGSGAFLNASSLTNVYIESIESWLGITFSNESANPMYKADYLYFDGVLATDIVIPESVTSIGDYAFCNYLNLKTITIPASVKSIGYHAFYKASSITDVYAESIESWLEIKFGGYYSNPLYYAQNLYFDGVLATDIVIPESITSIGDYAFHNYSNLASITIPESVTSIGEYAFNSCSNLKDVTFLGCSAKIGYSAFSYCSKLVNVYAESVESWLGLTFASSSSNPMCYADNFYINNKIETKIVIPDSITTIRSYAFYNCSAITEVIIPDSVTTIRPYAFYNCSAITEVIIPDNVTIIPTYAFYNCKSLTDITIPSGTTTIEDYAFSDCSYLKNVTIPKETTKIGIYAFDKCSRLDNMIIDKENPNYSAIDGVLFNKDKTVLLSYHNKSGTEYTIPDGVEIIGEYAFYGAPFKKIYIPDTVTVIEKNAFKDCYLADVYYDGTENDWASVDVAYTNYDLSNMIKHFTDSKEIIFSANYSPMYIYLYEDGTLILNSSESYSVSMYDYSSSFCPWQDYRDIIKKVIINGNFSNIGAYAFSGCCALESVEMFGSTSSMDIGDYAFSGCTALERVEISDHTYDMSIGDYAFYNCSSLKSMDVLSYWNYGAIIGESAFAYCSSLEEISISNGVEISDYSFRQCTKLKKIYLYGGSIDANNFKPTETSFVGVVADVLYPYASIKYSGVMQNYGGTLTWKECYYGPSGPTSVWEYDIDKKELTVSGEGNIVSKSNGTKMPWGQFAGEIVSIKIEEGINVIDSYAFEYCENVETVELPTTLKYLCMNAFNDCEKLNNLIIPDSVEVLGYEEFNRCYSLTDLYYFGTETEWNSIEGSAGVRRSDSNDFSIHFLIDCSTPPTCTETGTKTYYQYDKTDVYNEMYDENKNIISAPVSIPKINHSFTEYVANGDATCMNYGTKTACCDYNCGNSKTIQGDLYGDHYYTSEITKPATCIADGEKVFACTVCEDTYTEEIPATGEHSWVDASCTTAKMCTICNATEGDALGHNIVVVNGSDATCTETGLTEGRCCSVCETVIEDQKEIPALGHNVVVVTGVEATCTATGLTEGRYCSVCNYVFETQQITPALGHDWKVITDTYKECNRCGETDYDTSVTLSNVTGRPGETVEVYVSFAKDTDVKTMSISGIVYDASKLTLVKGEWLAEDSIIANWDQNKKAGVITFKENKALSGNIFVLTFEIQEELEDCEVEIDCDFGIKAMNENNVETALTVEVIPGSVKIINIIKGDVNGDDYVDSNDAIHLLYNTMLPDMYEVNQDCDFDGNGYVDSNDAIYLLYYTMLPDIYPLA